MEGETWKHKVQTILLTKCRAFRTERRGSRARGDTLAGEKFPQFRISEFGDTLVRAARGKLESKAILFKGVWVSDSGMLANNGLAEKQILLCL